MGISVKGFSNQAKLNAVNNLPPEAIAEKYMIPLNEVIRGEAAINNPNYTPTNPSLLLMTMDDATEVNGATVTNVGVGYGNVDAKWGGSASFSGSQYSSVEATNIDDLGSAFTIEFWIKPTTFASQQGVIGNYLSANFSWAFHIITGTGVNCFVGSGGNSSWDIVNLKVIPTTLNVWNHVAMTWDGTTYRGYSNGTRAWEVISSVKPGTTVGNLVLGTSPSNTAVQRFVGKLDDFRITDTAQYVDATYTIPTEAF